MHVCGIYNSRKDRAVIAPGKLGRSSRSATGRRAIKDKSIASASAEKTTAPQIKTLKMLESNYLQSMDCSSLLQSARYSTNPIPNPIGLHLLSGSRVPNGIRAGLGKGRGIGQLKKEVWFIEHLISTVSSLEPKKYK